MPATALHRRRAEATQPLFEVQLFVREGCSACEALKPHVPGIRGATAAAGLSFREIPSSDARFRSRGHEFVPTLDVVEVASGRAVSYPDGLSFRELEFDMKDAAALERDLRLLTHEDGDHDTLVALMAQAARRVGDPVLFPSMMAACLGAARARGDAGL
jgi:hypothetical protein